MLAEITLKGGGLVDKIREGGHYKTISLFGKTFEIKYGYYEEYERARSEPVPIYPDLKENPVYTDDGYPIVTQMQELCEMGESKFQDGFCTDCKYFEHGDDLIGRCTCEANRKK